MLNRFYSKFSNNHHFFNYQPLEQTNFEIDLVEHLKKIHENDELLNVYQKYLDHLRFMQNTPVKTLILLLSGFTSIMSQISEKYAHLKLKHIIPTCMVLNLEYEGLVQHHQYIVSRFGSEGPLPAFLEELFRKRKELFECDNYYSSMEYYTAIVGNIAFAIHLSILINRIYSYLSAPSQYFSKQISSQYHLLYKQIDDELVKIADKFSALSDDDKLHIKDIINKKFLTDTAIEQDAAKKFFLKYFCNCKQGYIVQPIEVTIAVMGPDKKMIERSELYETYFFFGYLQTQVKRRDTKSLYTPSGVPIVRYQFSSKVNREHMEYWIALRDEINKLALNNQQKHSLVLR